MAENYQAMDLDLPDVDPPTIRSTLRTMPHDRQWEHLKPILARVYHDHSVKDIAKMMWDLYGFDAK
jgi:hypothetical protein